MALANMTWDFSFYSLQSDQSDHFPEFSGQNRYLDQANLSTFDANLSYAVSLENVLEAKKRFFLVPIYNLTDELQNFIHLSSPHAGPYSVTGLEYKNLQQRFENVDANYAEVCLGKSYTDFDKLQKEVTTALFLLDLFITEMKENSTVFGFKEHFDNIFFMTNDEKNLLAEVEQKREMLQKLRQSVSKQRDLKCEMLNSLNSAIQTNVGILRDENETRSLEVRYYKNWQEARCTQNKLKLYQKEKSYSRTILHKRLQIEKEDLCHQDINDFLKECEKDSIEQINAWMKDYENTLEKKDTSIYNIRMQIEKLNDQVERMKTQYEERANAIEDWLNYKKKRKLEKIFQGVQYRGAVKIQTWWRNVMVEKQLGPYKPVPKRAKKKNGQNKKTNKN